MKVRRLQIEQFRNLESIDLIAGDSLNLLIGDNGAGKTSVIEALYTLARGRSFRSPQAADLIRVGAEQFRIVAELEIHDGAARRLGLQRDRGGWRARRDGQEVRHLSELAEGIPIVLMEPNSHLLVSGPPEGRRRFLDWGVFHVEHRYVDAVRRYGRALKQRNAALRQSQVRMIRALDTQLVESADIITRAREAYVSELAEPFARLARHIGLEDAPIGLSYRQGWKGDNLAAALAESVDRDLDRGMTTPGPHRADLLLRLEGRSTRHHLSRGEQKTLAAALLLAQATHHFDAGRPPLILLDDPASEFDSAHFTAVLRQSLRIGGQTWLTGTDLPPAAFGESQDEGHAVGGQGVAEGGAGDDEGGVSGGQNHSKTFHVKHGKVTELV